MNTVVKNKIGRICHRHFLIPEKDLKTYRKLQDLGINNMEKMEMMLYLEDAFRINLNDNDVNGINTLGDAIATVERYIAGGRKPLGHS